jgi:DNA-binding FadR family transcriptional regulator
MPSPEKLDVLWQHHYDIFVAIKSKDPEGAKLKVIEHLDFIEAKIKEDMGVAKEA